MFLPTISSHLMQKLGYNMQKPIHYLMDNAWDASNKLGIDKKSRLEVHFTYHEIRLNVCWRWLVECYEYSGKY